MFCLNGPGGFDSSFQPINPALGSGLVAAFEGVFTFDRAGQGTLVFRTANLSIGVAPANPSFVPNAGSADHSGPFTYKVGSDGTLTVNAFDVSATVLSGPGAGANLVIDEIELSGLATADGKSLTLGSTEPVVQTLTFPNAAPVNRVCEYALVLTRLD